MNVLPSQLDDLLASAAPELRATLNLDCPSDAHSMPEPPFPQDEPIPWTGVVHEVFTAGLTGSERFASHHPPPLAVLISWAQRQVDRSSGRLIAWVGRRLWPYPRLLDRAGLVGASLFVDATDNNQRLWASELSLRSPAVACVIADGSGFAMAATRRLQLVARQSEALMLLARPARDESNLSAAGARWRVGMAPDAREDGRPLWKVELLRCKGVRPASFGSHGQSPPAWTLGWEAGRASVRIIDREVDHGPSRPRRFEQRCQAAPTASRAAAVPGGLPADLAGRPPAAPLAPPRRRTG